MQHSHRPPQSFTSGVILSHRAPARLPGVISVHVALSCSQHRSPAPSLAHPHRHTFTILLHTFPPLIALRTMIGGCVWGGISTSLQLPSINAKCWPSNKTLITSCSSLHTQQNVQCWHQGCSQLLQHLWEAVITDILCSAPETGLNLYTAAL